MKRCLTIICGLLTSSILVLGMAGCAKGNDKIDSGSIEKGVKTVNFTAGQLVTAEAALAKGITMEDGPGDYVHFPAGSIQPDGRPDNADPYPLPYTDLKSVSISADADYLYVRWQFHGEFPASSVEYNGDLLWNITCKIEEFTFTDGQGLLQSATLTSSLSLADYKNGQWVKTEHPSVGQLAMVSPTGQDSKQEILYKINTGEGLVAGGVGQDYILSAFPLSLFGIKIGDEVVFSCATETGSQIYHHASVDVLFGTETSKAGAPISYKLGSGEYKVGRLPDSK